MAAAMTSGAVKFTPALPLNQSTKPKSFSSSSYKINGGERFGLTVDRPIKRGLYCNCLFGLGVPEIAVIVGVTALVFGPKQIPEMGKSIGKTVKSFQQAAREFESELKKDAESAEPSSEKITLVIEEDKQEVTVATTKESY